MALNDFCPGSSELLLLTLLLLDVLEDSAPAGLSCFLECSSRRQINFDDLNAKRNLVDGRPTAGEACHVLFTYELDRRLKERDHFQCAASRLYCQPVCQEQRRIVPGGDVDCTPVRRTPSKVPAQAVFWHLLRIGRGSEILRR